MLRIAFFLNVLDYARGIAELVPFAVDDTKAFVCVELPDLLERLVAELVKDTPQIKAPECFNPHLSRTGLLGSCHERFAIRRLALHKHSGANVRGGNNHVVTQVERFAVSQCEPAGR